MRMFLGCAVLLAVGATEATAATKWTTSTRPYLEARSTESESDASLRALCRNSAAIGLRVGAAERVGNGKGEKVKLLLESQGKTATLEGISTESEDSPMTGGTELVTEVGADSPVFAVLQTGKAVKLSGSLEKPVVWSPQGMGPAVKAFLAACKKH
jgi:hypothetical protein